MNASYLVNRSPVIDFRLPTHLETANADLTYLLLTNKRIILYRIGEGNKYPWNILSESIQPHLAKNTYQSYLDDIAIDPAMTLVLNPRVSDPEKASCICKQLIQQNVISPSAPVIVLYEDGWKEQMGAAGSVQDMDSAALNFKF